MAEPDNISASAIQLYLTCSLKYRFQYVDKLPRLTVSSNQVFGIALHAAISWLHKERKHGRTPPLDEVLRVFEADWYAQKLGEHVLFEDEDEESLLLIKGKELLSQFYHLPATPIRDSEVRFSLPLVNPATGEVFDVPLKGFIDLVQADDTVDEYKSSAKAWALESVVENVQLTVYSYAFQMLYGKPPKEVRLVNLIKTKVPRIEVQTTGREPRDYERLFTLGKEVVKGIRSDVFIPNRGCWLCWDCEYQEDCLEWAGNEEGEVVVSTRNP